MSIYTVLIGLALAAQVAEGDRYPDSDGSWLPSAIQQGSGATNAAAGQQTDSSPPGEVAPPPAVAPDGRADEVYSSTAGQSSSDQAIAPLDAGGGQSFLPGGTGTLSSGSAAPPIEVPQPPTSLYQSAATAGLAPRNAEQAGDETGQMPAEMLRAMLAAPPGSRLSGEPVSLDEVAAGAASRAEQTDRVEAYWDLCASVAEYYLCLREHEDVGRLRPSAPRPSAVIEEMEAKLSARIVTAERAALVAQHRLAGMIGRGADRLPLPTDRPHCGSYHTRYDQVFAGRWSPEAGELSELLPLRYAELQEACAAVTRSEAWLGDPAASTIGMAGDATLAQSWELLALRRRAFLRVVRDYNHRIARYVELAAPGPVDSERLIGMLIKRDVPAMATRPSTAAPLDRRSSSEAGAPRTFAEGAGEWVPTVAPSSDAASDGQEVPRRDGSVTPASAEAAPVVPGERSLLVPPR